MQDSVIAWGVDEQDELVVRVAEDCLSIAPGSHPRRIRMDYINLLRRRERRHSERDHEYDGIERRRIA